MAKDVILTGIRANNDLHIGNYFGALLPMVDMAKNKSAEFEINLFVPDLHSFTTPIDHSKLYEQTMHNLKLFVAAGLPLDNDSIHIYRQSFVPAHSELTWILDCFTFIGEMSRMTQLKDKIEARKKSLHEDIQQMTHEEGFLPATPIGDVPFLTRSGQLLSSNESVSVGLFNYPVLMAADILLYGAKYVPVGDDQTQHLEFTRDIAERMNKQFGELFVVPESVAKQHEFFGKDQGLRIRDLVYPTKKMSKSHDSERGVIFLGDNPEEAAKKIMSATTDSESTVGNPDFDTRPGVANLKQLLELLDPGAPDVSGLSYKDFKGQVASSVKDFLINFQDKLAGVDEAAVRAKLESDEARMNEVANVTLTKVQKAVGLRP